MKNTKIFILFFALFYLFTSCKKEEKMGLEVLPQSEIIKSQFYDKTEIQSFIVATDTFKIKNLSKSLIGEYEDPIFGTNKAGFITQINLSKEDVDFGENFEIDSIVFYLSLDRIFGDSIAEQELEIYEINKDLEDIDYKEDDFNDLEFYDNDGLIVSKNIVFFENEDFNDSIAINMTDENPEFKEKMQILFSDNTNLENNESFLEKIKGFYLKSTKTGVIASVNLLNSFSCMTLFYKNSEDTTSHIFNINEDCIRLNSYERYYENTDFFSQIDDTLNIAEKIYLQGIGGLRSKIDFPELFENWTDTGKICVNKAELIFTIDESSFLDKNYSLPDQLYLEMVNEDGISKMITDLEITQTYTYFGGYYNEEDKTYKFNISKYIQDLIDGNYKTYGLRLMTIGSAILPQRVVLEGDNNIKLNLTYTKL